MCAGKREAPGQVRIPTRLSAQTPDWSRAWAQAWIPGHAAELWTFSRSYTEGVHLAFDVAVGKPGWVHLVGIAELAKGLLVPLFVTVYP